MNVMIYQKTMEELIITRVEFLFILKLSFITCGHIDICEAVFYHVTCGHIDICTTPPPPQRCQPLDI